VDVFFTIQTEQSVVSGFSPVENLMFGHIVLALLILTAQHAMAEKGPGVKPEAEASATKLNQASPSNQNPASAPKLDLQEFLKEYLIKAEGLKISEFNYEMATLNFERSDNLYKSRLRVGGGTSHQESSTQFQAIMGNVHDASIGVSQSLPTGTTLDFNFEKFFNDGSYPSLYFVENRSSARLTQSLWRNGFGFSDRMQLEAAEFLYKANTLKARIAGKQACLDGVSIFVDAWVSEQRFKLEENLLKDADRAEAAVKQAFQQGLLSRLAWSSARIDANRSKESWLIADQNKRNAFTKLKSFYESHMGSLESPESFLLSLNVPKLEAQDTVGVQAANMEAQQAEKQYESVRSASRAKVDLFAEASRSEGNQRSVVNTGGSNLSNIDIGFREDVVKVGIGMDFSIFDKEPSRDEAHAYKNKLLKEELMKRELRQVAQAIAIAIQKIQTLKERIKLLDERRTLASSQVPVAMARLLRGQMEYTDYLNYRDQFVRQSVDRLLAISELWASLLTMLVQDKSEQPICGGQS